MPKRKSYSVKEKLEVISRVRNGETQAKVSRETGVPGGTLRGWLKDEHKLKTYLEEVDTEDGLQMRKAVPPQDPVMDKATFAWFVQKRAEGVPISGPLIQTEAIQISAAINGETSFKASNGWLYRWKKRHGIRQVKIRGEARSADEEAAEAFLPELQRLVEEEGYCPDQIYNTDETALYYKMLPDHSLAVKTDTTSSQGLKQKKDRLTLLLTCNWAGTHKLKPLCIGKFKCPRCFHHVNMSSMPLLYKNSRNAWMTAVIFEEWFHQDFVPSVRKHLRRQGLEEKAVLLLDNCPAHPPKEVLTSRDGKIVVFYLPKNTTSKIQPLDQGIISTFKRHYRRELLRSVLAEDSSLVEFLKALSIKDAFYLMDKAWVSIEGKSIRAVWDKALGNPFNTTSSPDKDDDEEEFWGFTQEDIQAASDTVFAALQMEGSVEDFIDSWATMDDDVPTVALSSREDFIQEAQGQEEGEEQEDDCTPAPKVSLSEAVDMTAKLQLFYESSGDIVRALRAKYDNQELKKQQQGLKMQAKITDMFKKS